MGLIQKLTSWVAGAVAILLSLWLVVKQIADKAKAEERLKNAKKELATIVAIHEAKQKSIDEVTTNAKEVKDNNARLSDDDVNQRLRDKWSD